MDTPTTRRIDVFGTRADYMPVVQFVEDQASVKYVLYGLFEQPDLKVYSSGEQLDDLGMSPTGARLQDHCYWVLPTATPVRMVPVPQRRGGVRYKIDPELDPISIGFCPGGLYGSNCIISGLIGVSKRSLPVAHQLYDLFLHAVKIQFIRVNRCFVGQGALRLAGQGYRLANDAKRPSWDLRR